MSVPTKWQIAQHWNGSPDRASFAPMLETLDHPCCFACAWYSERWVKETPKSSWERATLERAHIIPASLGGSDGAANLILLCAPCHRDSPDLPDEVAIRRIVDVLWESTRKAGIHAGELSSGTKVAIVRDTANRVQSDYPAPDRITPPH